MTRMVFYDGNGIISRTKYPSVFNIGWEQYISDLFAELLFIIANNPSNLLVLNSPACGGIVFNVNGEYGFLIMP